jgi:hypothetical protein
VDLFSIDTRFSQIERAALESDERVKNNYTKIKQNESSIEQLISTLTLSRKKCAWENDELKLELDQLEEHLSQEIRRVAKPINIL